MPLVKCDYCPKRVHRSKMPLHLRRCLNARKARRKPILTIERIEPIDVIGLEEAKIIDKGKKKRGRPKGSKNETNN